MSQDKVNINDEREVRIAKVRELEAANINPYPASTERTHTVAQALAESHDTAVTVAGRIMRKREMGKLVFCHIKDASGLLQVVLKKDDLGDESFKQFTKLIDGGDIVQFAGSRFITKKGEESVLVNAWKLLTKAVLPLPDKFHGLNDDETRYRKRYLDFLVNEENKAKIVTRSRVVQYMREFLYNKGFLEVETPMLETVASGAMARTFDTYLNAFDLPVHLRICIGELWQKRLLVGGFEKTFEIGRAFRNEGVGPHHNPEFTMIEFYWAYADYEDNIALHEEMLPYIVEKATGSTSVSVGDETIEFKAPYPRITFRDAVLEHSGIDLNEHDTVESLQSAMKDKGYEVDPSLGKGNLMDSLFKQTARPKIVQPTFVLNYPEELKPLAKRSSEDPRYTEMFQLVVTGFELSNSYTELNDPLDQLDRFECQAKSREAGDEEAMHIDHDYVEALEHGMPPATGTGVGIDRFVALLTDSHSIREILAFPLMKPIDQ